MACDLFQDFSGDDHRFQSLLAIDMWLRTVDHATREFPQFLRQRIRTCRLHGKLVDFDEMPEDILLECFQVGIWLRGTNESLPVVPLEHEM